MFLSRGQEAIAITPTFSMYEHCTKVQKAIYTPVMLKNDFSLDTENLFKAIKGDTRIIFICSPNNPTANRYKKSEIEFIAENYDGLLVIDEAYVEFAKRSIDEITDEFENVIVFRTFSKAFGLAGLRLGYAITNSQLAEIIIDKFQMPFAVSKFSLKMGIKLLENVKVINDAVNDLKLERERLIKNLRATSGIQAFNSETNFVLFRTKKNSDLVHAELLKKGIMIRKIGDILNLKNCLRVTVAPNTLLDKFMSGLNEVMDEPHV
jgi:histidinol-phosphate aminotransferase